MKLAKTSANSWAVLAFSFCLVPAAGAQSRAGQEGRSKARRRARKPRQRTRCRAGRERWFQRSRARRQVGTGGGEARSVRAAGQQHEADARAICLRAKRTGHRFRARRRHGEIAERNAGGGLQSDEQRVYFIREGDRLYDGDVEKIGLDGVTFKENSKDAFGKPVERMVTKRIYASAGEQQ